MRGGCRAVLEAWREQSLLLDCFDAEARQHGGMHAVRRGEAAWRGVHAVCRGEACIDIYI